MTASARPPEPQIIEAACLLFNLGMKILGIASCLGRRYYAAESAPLDLIKAASAMKTGRLTW